MSMSVSTNTTSHPVVDPCQAEALLKATTEFIAHISAANDTQVLANNSSHKLALAKPIFRRLKLWERSYNTAAYPLDRVLSCAPIQAETILLLLCHFVIIVVEEFGTLVTSDALGKLQNAMSGVPFMSPEDNESQSSTDETESDMSGSPTHEDVETTKYAMSELSHIVESLFDLSTVLDEKIQELEDRDRIMETDIHHSTDIRALIVNIGSKFPQAPESLVELVSSNIHINRRRLNRALREPSSEESFLAESTSQPNIKSTPASRFTVFNINRSQTSTVADSHSIRSIGSSMNSTNDLSFCDTPLSTVFTGTSYTTTSFLEIPSIAESLFSSSIASSDGEASANHGIPPKPVADSGGRIKCLICGNRITVSRRGGWRRHVFQDVQPYMCLEPTCHPNFLTGCQSTFTTRKLWKHHYTSSHKLPEPRICPFRCVNKDILDVHDESALLKDEEWYTHVRRHLEELTGFALRPSLWQKFTAGDGNDNGSAKTIISGATDGGMDTPLSPSMSETDQPDNYILKTLRERVVTAEDKRDFIARWGDSMVPNNYINDPIEHRWHDPSSGDRKDDGRLKSIISGVTDEEIDSLLLPIASDRDRLHHDVGGELQESVRAGWSSENSEISQSAQDSYTLQYDGFFRYRISATEEQELDPSVLECLKSLDPYDFKSHRDFLLHKRHEETCVWLLHDRKFKRWSDKHHQTVLWISGNLGSGKSVMSAFLSTAIYRDEVDQLPVVYFFCSKYDEKRGTASQVLANWLAQLLLQVPSWISYFPVKPECTEERFWTFDMLWEVFQHIMKEPNNGKICLLIDGLDECEESSRTLLLERVKNLLSDGSTNNRLKLIITSRPHMPVTSCLDDVVQISLDMSNISGDIELFVEAKARNLTGYSHILRAEIVDALIDGANGIFLWVARVLDELSTSPKPVQGTMRELIFPEVLRQVYIESLYHLPTEYQREVQILLRWVVWAERPLTIPELVAASAVGPDDVSLSDVREKEIHIKGLVQVLLGSILRIDDNNTVHLIHPSARDFLLKIRTDDSDHPPLWAFEVPFADSHLHIALACIAYLSLDECDQRTVTGRDLSSDRIKLWIANIERKLLFHRYASAHWPEHARKAYSEKHNKHILSGLRTLEKGFRKLASSAQKFGLAYLMFCFSWNKFHLPTKPLQVVAYHGLHELAQDLLDSGEDIEKRGGRFGNPLNAAAINGNEETVRVLLDYGANVNATSPRYGSALVAAAIDGNEEMARMLLEHGADVNVCVEEYGDALQQAALKDNLALARLFLDHGANVTALGGRTGSALVAAATNGNEQLARLLIDCGADVNATSPLYGSALVAATTNGNEEVARLLIDHGADVNFRGGEHGTALNAAVADGNIEMVQLLLDHGADVNAPDKWYGCVLNAAVARDNEDVVQLLLESGADVNVPGGPYENALNTAVTNRNEEMVQLLLEYGAINAL